MKRNKLIINNQYNIGYITTTLQCERGLSEKTALKLIANSRDKGETILSFGELDRLTNRFANLLQGLGFSAGDIFFTFLPRCVEQYVSFLGTLKAEVVSGVLFSNFGEEAVLDRLGDSGAKGVITKKSFLKKFKKIRSKLPSLQYILVIDIDEDMGNGILSCKRLMSKNSDKFDIPITSPHTPSVLHYTSGSTGKPKGVLHVHKSILLQNYTGVHVLDLKEEDRYWCTADMGWVTGTSYGVIAPWSVGATQIQTERGYNVGEWMDLLKEEEVTVWYSAPTALRMLMQEDPGVFENLQLPYLRHIFSVGEPLNPEIIHWRRKIFNKDIYDTYFQTETGAIMVSNRPGLPLKEGSMGKPIDPVDVEIISDEMEVIRDNSPGNLCIKPGWDSMFVEYINNRTVYEDKFKKGYYYTGDRAYRDDEGYIWFLGRSDDIINTAGHLVSPFEVESALLEIDDIAESGVVGVPDAILFEKVIAFVKLKSGVEYDQELELKIKLYVMNKISSIASPQEIFVRDNIPKNKSGKILRRVLKAEYMGTDPGDISTLE